MMSIIDTLPMSTRDIGLMKAMGMSGRKIFALFRSAAVFLGFLGRAIGAVVAIGVGSLITLPAHGAARRNSIDALRYE